ncbi:MAG: hypothetical protein EON57_18035, partial [Alphaproteobacteria bacterium]
MSIAATSTPAMQKSRSRDTTQKTLRTVGKYALVYGLGMFFVLFSTLLLLWAVLFTKLFPRVVVIVPFFVTLRNLQMMNTYQGLILV